MSLSSADHRRRRGNAKGIVTRAAQTVNLYRSRPVESFDLLYLGRQSEIVERADATFQLHNTALSELDDGIDEDQYVEDDLDHQSSVSAFRQLMCDLKACKNAHTLGLSITTDMEDLESDAALGYSSFMEPQFSRIEDSMVDFKKLISSNYVREHEKLSALRVQLRKRWLTLSQLREGAVVVKERAATATKAIDVSSREVRTLAHGLKVGLPTFNGSILTWRNFWGLFSSVVEKNTQLNDHEKNCLLIKAMGTADAKSKAESAVAATSTYEAAVARLREHYELNKELHAHHLNEMLTPDHIEPVRGDIERLLERIEKSTNGMELANGYTAGQVFTAYLEGTLSPSLKQQWRRCSSKCVDPPIMDVFTAFLKNQLKVTSSTCVNPIKLDKSHPQRVKSQRSSNPSPHSPAKTVFQVQGGRKCNCCQGDHSMFACPTFRDKTPSQRQDWVKSAKLCFNCLSPKHKVEDCPSKHRCQECKRKHNTLVHLPTWTSSSSEAVVNIMHTVNTIDAKYVLPVTAIVTVTSGGLEQKARALLDTGATVSLITRSLANTLKAKRISNSSISLTGVTGTGSTLYEVELTLEGDERVGCQDERVRLRAHVVENISPSTSKADVQKIFKMPFLDGLPLADPNYTSAATIDMILDVGSFFVCRRGETRISATPSLNADKTIFGWIVGGSDTGQHQEPHSAAACYKVSSTLDDPDSLLQRFWEVEQLPDDVPSLSADERQACVHFKETFRRDPDGRFRVSLPRKTCGPTLGPSRDLALQRYLRNERSLQRQGTWEEYDAAVCDYSDRGHAELVPIEDSGKPSHLTYYLPMHGVTKMSSTTTKLRPVCDASAKSGSGASLNDTLLTGPSLYPLLTSVVNKFRLPAIAMTADVSKMYRQIGLNDDEKDYHRFLHRDKGGEIKDLRMTRLTFGVKTSPYLATQVLHQLAQDHRQDHPEAAKIVETAFYVDDVLTGADTLSQAQHIREELNSILNRGCMPLCKWRTNSQKLLETIPEEMRELTDLRIVSTPDDCPKTLGLHWSTAQDCLFAATPDVNSCESVTKRRIASTVARIFDPLGWFTPATLPAKVMLQEAWALRLGWDDVLPDQLQQRWKTWVKEVPLITKHPIPRHLGLIGRKIVNREVHGFADASTLAYGGVIYLRTFYSTLEVSIDLVSSKARVAPLKNLTVPRLELCGALLLAQLMKMVAADLNIDKSSVYAWSDSAVVLGWLNKSPSRLSVFVANRVSKIISLVDASHWRYVDTKCNSADLLSRGVQPDVLMTEDLWWKGPQWLSLEPSQWPRRPDINLDRELPEMRSTVYQVVATDEEIGLNTSNFNRLVRVISWVLRFCSHAKDKQKLASSLSLRLSELATAKLLLLRSSQRLFYSSECNLLLNGKSLPKNHHLSPLSPYIDQDGLLRVGGRLQKASLSDSAIHPIILNTRSHTVQLLVEHSHRMMMHAGPSAVMASLSFTYHIPRLKPLLRKISRQCIACQKVYARTSQQLMGELPAARSCPSRPFSVVGIDYAGPLFIKRGNPRRHTLVKTYLCVFICLSSRAVHIEVVSDSTTAAFLAAMARFVARRGLPSQVHTDNGSNFVGAQAELKQTLEVLRQEASRDDIIQWAAHRNIDWHFTPARAPHFGGLWESAVKSMKLLLKKTLGSQVLTFEELTTVVAEAEAILNSRPLLPLDSPADDAIPPLTPGHFLIGSPLVALPLKTDVTSKLPSLRRWNLMKRLKYDLWQRWKGEYLTQMHRRSKWTTPQRNLQVGDIVLMKDADMFRRSWPLGRITKIHPGTDGLVRAVDVWSHGKTLRRPIVKLVLLLTEEASASGGECSGLETEATSRTSAPPD